MQTVVIQHCSVCQMQRVREFHRSHPLRSLQWPAVDETSTLCIHEPHLGHCLSSENQSLLDFATTLMSSHVFASQTQLSKYHMFCFLVKTEHLKQFAGTINN